MNYDHMVLSPHLDDAALSCGASINKWVEQGKRVIVATFFTRYDLSADSLTDFAKQVHAEMDLTVEDAAARRLEDHQAMLQLGCDYVYLDALDAIYRSNGECAHNSYAALFADLPAWENVHIEQLFRQLAQLLESHRTGEIIAPLAVGNHIDHQLVNRLAQRLQADYPVRYYPDYPYVDPEFGPNREGESQYSLVNTLARPEFTGLKARREVIAERHFQAKLRAIGAYQSQVDYLFESMPRMEQMLRNHNQVNTAEPMVETFWSQP
ncbi:PIG-L deacetylase family protein [Exilibacterium tricleocarpae]|nr:PIG-L family deacetylase [Exilibacterium tricleocarpae]